MLVKDDSGAPTVTPICNQGTAVVTARCRETTSGHHKPSLHTMSDEAIYKHDYGTLTL